MLYFLHNNGFSANNAQQLDYEDMKSYIFHNNKSIAIASGYYDFYDRFRQHRGYDEPYTCKVNERGEIIIGSAVDHAQLVAIPVECLDEWTLDLFNEKRDDKYKGSLTEVFSKFEKH